MTKNIYIYCYDNPNAANLRTALLAQLTRLPRLLYKGAANLRPYCSFVGTLPPY